MCIINFITMNKAAFSLLGYKFDKVNLDLSSLCPGTEFNIIFSPSGVFYPKTGEFTLKFAFSAKTDGNDIDIIYINCVATYKFKDVREFSEIPEYFYANSIAILFPYVRAFVSTVTLQANIRPIVLPTYNVSPLKDELIRNTRVSDVDD